MNKALSNQMSIIGTLRSLNALEPDSDVFEEVLFSLSDTAYFWQDIDGNEDIKILILSEIEALFTKLSQVSLTIKDKETDRHINLFRSIDFILRVPKPASINNPLFSMYLSGSAGLLTPYYAFTFGSKKLLGSFPDNPEIPNPSLFDKVHAIKECGDTNLRLIGHLLETFQLRPTKVILAHIVTHLSSSLSVTPALRKETIAGYIEACRGLFKGSPSKCDDKINDDITHALNQLSKEVKEQPSETQSSPNLQDAIGRAHHIFDSIMDLSQYLTKGYLNRPKKLSRLFACDVHLMLPDPSYTPFFMNQTIRTNDPQTLAAILISTIYRQNRKLDTDHSLARTVLEKFIAIGIDPLEPLFDVGQNLSTIKSLTTMMTNPEPGESLVSLMSNRANETKNDSAISEDEALAIESQLNYLAFTLRDGLPHMTNDPESFKISNSFTI